MGTVGAHVNPLLITEHRRSLKVSDFSLVLSDAKTGEPLDRWYVQSFPFDSIIFKGSSGYLTLAAIEFCFYHHIPIYFLSPTGEIESVILHGEKSYRSRIRIAQYRAYLDREKREMIGKAILSAKCKSQLDLVRELVRFYPYGYSESDFNFERLDDEKQVANAYFAFLAQVFNRLYPRQPYAGRKAYSASNNIHANHPINSLLNFGYALLEGRVRTLVYESGLEPSIGFVHHHYAGKIALVYDLMELGRTLIDVSVIRLLESGLTRKDFETDGFEVWVKDEAIVRLKDSVSETFNRVVDYHGKPSSYESILSEQVLRLSRFIEGKSKIEFDIPSYRIERNDTIDLRERILSITPQERKRSGIGKSTLHYLKKDMASERPRKVYRKVLERLTEI